MRKPFPSLIRQKWLQILVAGIVIFSATQAVLNITGNYLFFPMLLLVGAFTVPVVFIVFLHEQGLTRNIPQYQLAVCFFVGGAIGVLVSGLLEYKLLKSPGVANLVTVGLIEETSKLIMPLFEYVYSRHCSEKNGLIFGIIVGMGFAALETMGYGLFELTTSGWNVLSLDQVLLVRALLSPASHAAWTGLVTAAIWRERERNSRGGILSPAVFVTFITAVVLHFAWDFANAQQGTTVNGLLFASAGVIGVGIFSLYLLIRRMKEASRYQGTTALEE